MQAYFQCTRYESENSFPQVDHAEQTISGIHGYRLMCRIKLRSKWHLRLEHLSDGSIYERTRRMGSRRR